MAGLTTHVLDTATGLPVAGLEIELWSSDGKTQLAERVTNADGRTDKPLLSESEAKNEFYELRFFAGDYLKDKPGEPPFFDVISIRFRYSTDRPHHHIPLLLSPFGYSTYRGS